MRLKGDNQGIKSPLARARGLGSARHGSGHWMHERITALASLPLMLWLVWAVLRMPEFSYAQVVMFLSAPLNAILMLLAVFTVFYHALLGTQVIAEDYIHHEGLKFAKLVSLKLFYIAAGTACVFSILKIAFGG